eukprot:TRINITY_DN3811_c0_g1_i1.p1 TRINITY_DN3811_c0_g1~~TRINITY_DN3811_c0_g1_i1.p1  ORF type:complete len:273 (+),score=45.49 TRINITY_DN3811_c0_g1_i1:80-898(+)
MNHDDEETMFSTWFFFGFMSLSSFILALYIIVFSLALPSFLYIQRHAGGEEGWKTQKQFVGLLSLQALLRIVYFMCFVIAHLFPTARLPSSLFFFLRGFPTAIFVTTFSILITFWSQAFHFTKMRFVTPKMIAGFCFFFNAILILSFILSFLLHLFISEHTAVSSYQDYLTVSMFFLLSFAFCFYSIGLYEIYKNDLRQRGAIKGAKIAGICATAFLIRASFVLVKYNTSVSFFWLDLVTFILCEILPSLYMLYIFRKLPDHHNVRFMSQYS